MTPLTLRVVRQLLFFTQEEAAELIGHVTLRSWQYWEAGKRQIPTDVIEKVEDLCTWRQSEIHRLSSVECDLDRAPATEMPWYATIVEWASTGQDAALWRPYCSVVAEMCSRFGAVAVPATEQLAPQLAPGATTKTLMTS